MKGGFASVKAVNRPDRVNLAFLFVSDWLRVTGSSGSSVPGSLTWAGRDLFDGQELLRVGQGMAGGYLCAQPSLGLVGGGGGCHMWRTERPVWLITAFFIEYQVNFTQHNSRFD